MTTVQNFAYNDHPVRTILVDGEPAFIALDVCSVLGIVNVGDALSSLDEDEKGSIAITDGTPGNPNKAFVTEAGMYSLVLRSRKPEAKMFKRWITHDVLPQIRKTGAYAAKEISRLELIDMAREAELARLTAESRVLELAPKADAFDSFLSTTGDYSVNEAAKILARDHSIATGEKRLRSQLEEWGWIYRHSGVPRAKQAQIDNGRMTEKASFYFHPETGEKVAKEPQVRITPKGLGAIRDKWMGAAA